MKIFLFKFCWRPSEPEGIVVVAESEDEALEIVKNKWNYEVFDVEYEVFDVEKVNKIVCKDFCGKHYTVEEIDLNKKGVVYQGDYCC